jgi:D-3-phosphoglycerate dehydrogenase
VRVLVTDHVFPDLEEERALLEPLGATLDVAPSADEATLLTLAEGADAILVCYAEITPAIVDVAARSGCRVISRYGIGTNNIALERAAEHGLRVTYVPDYCLDEVADHTVALLLAHARQVVVSSADVRAGGWSVPHDRLFRLAGRRLALVGVGRIGRRVVERVRPFGIEVVGFDPYLHEDVPGLRRVDTIEEAVATAHYVSLHAPLTPATHHVVNAGLIAAMTQAPVIVNTSRGGLVDLDAAYEGLRSGRLSGLALDVTEIEPLPSDSPLRTDPRVIVTPHTAFSSIEATRDLRRRAADEVVRAFRGEAARSPVPS